MNRAVRSNVRLALLCSVIGLAAGGLLINGSSSPGKTIRLIRDVAGDRLATGSTERVTLLLVALVWIVISVLLVRACIGWWSIVRPSLHRFAEGMRSACHPAWLGSAVVVVTGLVASLKTINAAGDSGTGNSMTSEYDGADPAVGSKRRTDDRNGPIPVLASSGLAVGLVGHIRRERAILLASAPVDAKLAAPSPPSLSTGIALFERAGSSVDLAAVTDPPADASVSDSHSQLIIPLGIDHDRLVSVALRAGDTLSIDADSNEAVHVLRHILNTVVLAPWLNSPVVVVFGFTAAETIVDSTVRIAQTADDVRAVVLESMARRPDGNVVVVASRHDPRLDELAEHGALVITTGAGTHRPVVRVVRDTGGWSIPITGERFRPYGATNTEVGALRTMTKEMLRLEVDVSAHHPQCQTWESLIRVFGPVEIIRPDLSEVVFRKSKSVELLCWLAHHRDRPTVSGARTALWEMDVQDSTFHNVLSELRRGFAAAGLAEVAGRATKQRLFLDDRIATDGELLRRALVGADHIPPREAADSLCEVLKLVRGLPFASADYAWADAEGITSTLYWLVTRSIDRVIELVGGDEATQHLLDATAAGLRMAPGDETLMMVQRRSLSGMNARISTVRS